MAVDLQTAIDDLNARGWALNLYQYSLKFADDHHQGRPMWDATAYDRKTGKMGPFGIAPTWDAALAQLLDKVKGSETAQADPFDFETTEEDPLG